MVAHFLSLHFFVATYTCIESSPVHGQNHEGYLDSSLRLICSCWILCRFGRFGTEISCRSSSRWLYRCLSAETECFESSVRLIKQNLPVCFHCHCVDCKIQLRCESTVLSLSERRNLQGLFWRHLHYRKSMHFITL